MKKYIDRYRLNLCLAVTFGVLEVYFIYLFSIESSRLVDIIVGDDFGNVNKIVIYSIIYVIIAVASYYISQKHCKLFSTYISRDLRHDYLEGLLVSKSSLFFSENKGFHIAHIDQSVDQVRLDYLLTLPEAITGIGKVFVFSIGLYKIHPYILLTTVIFVIFPAYISKVFAKKISEAQYNVSSKYAEYIDRLNEILDGYFVIKEANDRDYFLKKFDKDDMGILVAKNKLNMSSRMLGEILFGLNILSSLLVTYIASILVSRSYLKLSDLLASLTLVSISTATLSDAFRYLVNVMSTKNIRNLVISQIPNKSKEKKSNKSPDMGLSIRNLSFAYGPIKVFDKMDLDIEKSKSYAIIGNSGSGKSTLAKILMKVNEDYGGEISFANGNFKDFSEEELYDSIYYIPQNPIVFEDTFINNIAMGDDGLDRDRIERIIDRVGLSRVYHEKKDGLIKNGSLSGGEKKKLELARALYKGSEVLIFDEPTSGLDPESARSIEGLIESLDNLTRIVITHNQDKAYLQSFDHVINIEDYKN